MASSNSRRDTFTLKASLAKAAAFLIFLPQVEGAADREHVSAIELPFGTETVLVAEDEELVRALAVRILAKQGFKVVEAANGLEALRAALKQKHIDILFTDMVMPQMGGGELAQKFLNQFPKASIIFTSGYSDQSAVQKWLDQGYRFLQKPYTQAELLLMLREVLDRGRAAKK